MCWTWRSGIDLTLKTERLLLTVNFQFRDETLSMLRRLQNGWNDSVDLGLVGWMYLSVIVNP